MRKITITLEASEEDDLAFIVTPGNEFQFGQLGVALAGIAQTQELTLRALRTLKDVRETKGANPKDIAKTVAQLDEPNRLAVEQIDFVRRLLGKSALIKGKPENRKGLVQ